MTLQGWAIVWLLGGGAFVGLCYQDDWIDWLLIFGVKFLLGPIFLALGSVVWAWSKTGIGFVHHKNRSYARPYEATDIFHGDPLSVAVLTWRQRALGYTAAACFGTNLMLGHRYTMIAGYDDHLQFSNRLFGVAIRGRFFGYWQRIERVRHPREGTSF